MKGAKIFFVVIIALAMSVAAVSACHEQVHVEDEEGNDMSGVLVELTSIDCDWGPVSDETDTSGWTNDWAVQGWCAYEARVLEEPQGYVCTTGQDYNEGDRGKIYLTCLPEHDVPEFGTLASLGILVAVGILVYRRRN